MINTVEEEIEKHITLIKSMAYGLASGELAEELIQAGKAALFEAMLVFDESKNNKLITFAYKKIRGAMLECIKQRLWFTKRNKERDDLSMCYIEDLASDLVDSLLLCTDIEDLILKREQTSLLRQSFDILDERQKSIIYLHYYESMPFAEIAKKWGMSEQGIAQTHNHAKERIRKFMEEKNDERY